MCRTVVVIEGALPFGEAPAEAMLDGPHEKRRHLTSCDPTVRLETALPLAGDDARRRETVGAASWVVPLSSLKASRTAGRRGPRRCVASPAPSSAGEARSWPGTAPGRRTAPPRALNSIIKKVKRVGAGFRSFTNYRLRILLAVGGCDWSLLGRAPR